MKVNILFGGKAGQGVNVLAEVLGKALVKQGYYAFCSRDYQSLIRGGHNFNVLTFSDKPMTSNEGKIDILVALDENTEKIHKKNLKKQGIILKGSDDNMYYAGKLFKLFCMDFSVLDKELKELEKRYEENIREARQGYKEEKKEVCKVVYKEKKNAYFLNGSQGIAEGAIKSGLDLYYGYPMTPATPVLGELAEKQTENNFLVLELENEIAVINAAVGSAITGAKSMIGTSGGGFDLMTEALSLTGQAEVPLVIYLATRPGPSTGVPTYTSQGDLNLARHSGHGEFPRIVLAPGDPLEAQELVSQAFYFSQKFKIPCIILGDKHLAESFYTLDREAKITKSKKVTSLKKYHSYEHDDKGISTEDANIISQNFEKRLKKQHDIEKEAKKFLQFKIYGKKESKNLIIGWGSTKGAILDALPNNARFLQVLYIEPFLKKIADELKKAKNIIIIENNSTSPLSQLIAEKTGIFIPDKNKILRYDGRPFLADELKISIEKLLAPRNQTAPSHRSNKKISSELKREIERRVK